MKCLEPFNMFIKVCLGLERSPNTAFFWKFPHLDGWWGIFSWSWLTEDSCLPVLQLCTEVPWDFACSRVNTFVRRQHLVPVIERQGFASLFPTIFQGKEARLRQTRACPSSFKAEGGSDLEMVWVGAACWVLLCSASRLMVSGVDWVWRDTLCLMRKRGCASCISEFEYLIFTVGFPRLNWTDRTVR